MPDGAGLFRENKTTLVPLNYTECHITKERLLDRPESVVFINYNN